MVMIGLMVLQTVPAVSQEDGDREEKKEPEPEEVKNSKRAKKRFSGDVKITPKTVGISEEGTKHFFSVRTSANFPEGTRVRVILYYQRKQKNIEDLIDHKVYENTVRVRDNGRIEAMLLGLKRSLWAGPYKVVFKVSPENQIRPVRKKLPDLDEPVQFAKTWYHGTAEQLEKQKKKAVKQARKDYYGTLELAEELKLKLREVQSGDLDVDDWEQWSKRWKKQLRKIEESNRRRPQFDGEFVEFHFVEDRTGFFLQFDLQSLRDVYGLADQIVRSEEPTPEQTQEFRKSYRELQRSIAKTLSFLKISIPLGKQKRKVFRKHLKEFTKIFQEMDEHISRRSEAEDLSAWTRKAEEKLTELQSHLFELDSDIPDFLYRRFTKLLKRVNNMLRNLSGKEGEIKKQFRSAHKYFRDVREISKAYLKELEDNDN